MENGDTEDEAGGRETSDEEKAIQRRGTSSEQEAPTSSHVHVTAGKWRAQTKRIEMRQRHQPSEHGRRGPHQ